jgi:hypothetical protein
MYIMAGLILLGLLCNALIRPVADKHFMTDDELAAERQLAHERALPKNAATVTVSSDVGAGSHPVMLLMAWAAVGIPLAWGISITVQKALILFK